MIAAQLVYHKEAYEVLVTANHLLISRSLPNLPPQLINSRLKAKQRIVLVVANHKSYSLVHILYLFI